MIDDIQSFIDSFEKKYDKKLQIFVVNDNNNLNIPDESTIQILERIIIDTMHKNNPDLSNIKSFSNIKTRRRKILLWMQVYSYLAVKLGYSKSHVGRSMNRDHATVIHRIKVVENLLSIGDKELKEVYNAVKKSIREYVGIISTNPEGKDDTRSILSALRDKKESVITIK